MMCTKAFALRLALILCSTFLIFATIQSCSKYNSEVNKIESDCYAKNWKMEKVSNANYVTCVRQ